MFSIPPVFLTLLCTFYLLCLSPTLNSLAAAVKQRLRSHVQLTGRGAKDAGTRWLWAGKCTVSPVRSGFDDISVFLTTIWLSFLAFRNDDQKYRQQGKTTSRKAQKRSEGKGKGHKGKWNLKNVWMRPKAVSMEKPTHFTMKLFVYRHQRQSDSEGHETFWNGWICSFWFCQLRRYKVVVSAKSDC